MDIYFKICFAGWGGQYKGEDNQQGVYPHAEFAAVVLMGTGLCSRGQASCLLQSDEKLLKPDSLTGKIVPSRSHRDINHRLL